MAEEKNLDPVLNPLKTALSKSPLERLGNSNRRASIASYSRAKWDKNNTRTIRRHSSILKPDSSTQFIVPHYLRASTGSCHDICKYGRRHSCEKTPQKRLNTTTSSLGKQKREKLFKPSLETKKGPISLKPFIVSKHYLPKRKSSSGPTTRDGVLRRNFPNLKTQWCNETHKPGQNFVLKKPFVVSKCYSPKFMPSSGAKTYVPSNKTSSVPKSTNENSGLSYPPEVIKRVVSLRVEKVKGPAPGASSIDQKLSRTVKNKFDQPVKLEPVSSFKNSDGMHGKVGRTNDVKNGTLSAKKTLIPRVAMLSPKLCVTKKAYLKARKGGADNISPPVQGRNGVHRIESGISNGGDSVKTLCVIKRGTKKSASSLPREGHCEKIKPSGNEMDEIVSDKTVCVQIVKIQPCMVPVEIGEVQPVKQNRDRIEKTASENKNAEDSISDNHVKAPSLLSDEGNYGKKTQRKNKMGVSEDKYSPPVKLKFRRGKIIELQHDNNNTPRRLVFRRSSRINNNTEHNFAPDNKKPPTSTKSHMIISEDRYISPTKLMRRTGRFVDLHTDSNTPRRLRFGRPRFIVDDQNGDYEDLFRRRSFKRSGSKDDLAGSEFSSRRVVLKRRNNLQTKKNNQLLFNNVIEETASKLVESRKSKVKALVGAFETVISLQERQL